MVFFVYINLLSSQAPLYSGSDSEGRSCIHPLFSFRQFQAQILRYISEAHRRASPGEKLTFHHSVCASIDSVCNNEAGDEEGCHWFGCDGS